MYDLIVIGAGPGGYEAAFDAAERGMKTCLIEKDALGGTCLNRGCIPTKSLLHASSLYRAACEGERFGVLAENVSYDLQKIQERKNEVVGRLRTGIEGRAKKLKVEVRYGTGSIRDASHVVLRTAEGEEVLETARILIATGSVPAVPPIPGSTLPGVYTSDTLLSETKEIGRLTVIGGGVIGAEFACFYRDLGKEVTVIEALPQMLNGADRELSLSLKQLFTKRGISVHLSSLVSAIEEGSAGTLQVRFSEKEEEKTLETDAVLLAVGRRCFTEGLFEEGFSVKTERGRILVDENNETSVPSVYAIGDVTGGIMLAHAAAAEGQNAVAAMCGDPVRPDLSLVPSCIYTEPEIAFVGLSLAAAKECGIDADSKKALMGANGRTVIAEGERGFVRIVFEKESGRILGAQLMCERASDMVGELTEAIRLGVTVRELSRVIHPHPTFAEAIQEALKS